MCLAGIIAFDSVGEEVVSFFISKRFGNEVTLVHMRNASMQHFRTCVTTDVKTELRCFKPIYLTKVSSMSILATTVYGVIQIHTNGHVTILIDPDNIKMRNREEDTSLSAVRLMEAGQIIPVDGSEDHFILMDQTAFSLRLINLAEKTAYVLCRDPEVERIRFKAKEPICYLRYAFAVLLRNVDYQWTIFVSGMTSIDVATVKYRGM